MNKGYIYLYVENSRFIIVTEYKIYAFNYILKNVYLE